MEEKKQSSVSLSSRGFLVAPSLRGDPISCFALHPIASLATDPSPQWRHSSISVVTGTVGGRVLAWPFPKHFTLKVSPTRLVVPEVVISPKLDMVSSRRGDIINQPEEIAESKSPDEGSLQEVDETEDLSLKRVVVAEYVGRKNRRGSVVLKRRRREHQDEKEVTCAVSLQPGAARLQVTKDDLFSDSGQVFDKDYMYKELCDFSEEGIRSIYSLSSSGRVFAVVGDLICKVWKGVASESVDFIKFKRVHEYLTCQSTFVAESGPHIALVTSGSSDLHYLNLISLEQKRIELPIMNSSFPAYYDGDAMVLVKSSDSSDTHYVEIWNNLLNSHSGSEKLASLKFPSSKSSYWGFQLNPSKTRLIIVSVHCKFSIWDISKKDSCKKLTSFAAHKGSVASFLVEEDEHGELVIISIGSEKVIKIWHGTRCVRKIRNISGEFQMGYLYFVKRYGDFLFYTADDGLYCIPLASKLSVGNE
jgi:hypothetical protein